MNGPSVKPEREAQARRTLREWWALLQNFPWANTLATLRERFVADQLGLTASSLTFTTTLALVPLFTLALAVFTAFPMFGKLQVVLQQWLVDSLMPESIAKQVASSITQFTSKASRLGLAGLGVLLITALALMLTIDKTLNRIWRVKTPRPLTQRVLVYWAGMTLGPLLLAGSLALTSYVLSAGKGWVGAMPGGLQFLFSLLQFALMVLGAAAMYRFVPNTFVAWRHAFAGAAFVAVGFEVAQAGLAWYLTRVPTYSAVYGAFATVPILLVWIYLAWAIVLLGAVVAAYLPVLRQGVRRRPDGPGWRFRMAVEAAQALAEARAGGQGGLSSEALAKKLRVDVLQIEPALDLLRELEWAGTLATDSQDASPRHVLLTEPSQDATALVAKALTGSRDAARLAEGKTVADWAAAFK